MLHRGDSSPSGRVTRTNVAQVRTRTARAFDRGVEDRLVQTDQCPSAPASSHQYTHSFTFRNTMEGPGGLLELNHSKGSCVNCPIDTGSGVGLRWAGARSRLSGPQIDNQLPSVYSRASTRQVTLSASFPHARPHSCTSGSRVGAESRDCGDPVSRIVSSPRAVIESETGGASGPPHTTKPQSLGDSGAL